ncbi:eukaryotic translation initiation factor 5B [Glossina fuscipes]|uniref:Eukaryotic translation initiation factor 5B n=1 Tax=Glossina fuscipes TaxID=7396 RepID=A0A8U0WCP0_9MUSC|nr:eukaryotic translation initiation factor 5B [Glossina fuscipes]
MARLVFAEKGVVRPRRSRMIKNIGWRSVRLLLEPSTRKWWEDPDVVVAFNLPRISAALERLMGTNVVRLTDRNYMKELRERIEDDYRQQLNKRICARELKELERERILIIEGQTDTIPIELSEDPIFVVNKKASVEIKKARAKLKTNREKNSERLKLQGVKWERERLQHEEEERAHIDIMRERYKEQEALEEKFKQEDAVAGMNLLRIDNEDWRPCEANLKNFLEQERAKMKERSLRVPTPFTSDPKDMQTILREKKKAKTKAIPGLKQIMAPEVVGKLEPSDAEAKKQPSKHDKDDISVEHIPGFGLDLTEDDLDHENNRKNLASDDASDMSSGESFEEGSTISMAKQRYALMLQEELENDVASGLLISKEQYDHLRYEDEKILQLRNARDIRELYQLAEEIIMGERVEEIVEEEETEGEGEGHEDYEHDLEEP